MRARSRSPENRCRGDCVLPRPRDPRELLRGAARALGPELDAFVVVGGCAPVAYDLGPVVTELRPTLDVDCIVDVDGYAAYVALIERLTATIGLRHVTRRGAPICRYEVGGVEVDLLPVNPSTLGFAGRWYPDVVRHARRVELGDGITVRVADPLHFVATKLDALADRGSADLRLDGDLEDIVAVLRGVRGLLDEIAAGEDPVHAFVRSGLKGIVTSPDVTEIVGAHFEADAATQALVGPFLVRVRAACR